MGLEVDWSALSAVVAVTIAALVALDRLLSRGLSIREHDEFKARILRELDRIDRQIDFIAQTRPTAGQLQDAINNVKEQLMVVRTGVKNGPKA